MNETIRNWTLRLVILAWFAAAVALLVTPAMAVTYTVPVGGDIQAAINNASAGDTVQLSAGVYSLSSPLTAKSGVALVGAGTSATTLTPADGSVDTFIDLDGRSNVKISNLSLDGAGRQVTYGIVGGNGSGHTLTNLAVKNLTKAGSIGPIGIYFGGNVTNSQIANNRFENIGVDSFWGTAIRLGHGSVHHLVESNTITGVGRGGILANDGSSHLTIRSNTVTQIGVNNPRNPLDNEITPRLGIELWHGSGDSLVENNTVDHYISVDGSSRVAVRNNTIGRTNTTTTAFIGLELVATQDDDAAYDATDVIFTGNTIVTPATAAAYNADLGVSLSGDGKTEHALFDRNTINRSGTWAMQVMSASGANGVTRRLYFLDNSFSNTLDGNPGPYASFGLHGDAIRLNAETGDMEDLVFYGNQVNSNFGAAVGTLDAKNIDDVRFTANTAADNGGGNAMANIGSPSSPVGVIVDITPGNTSGDPVELTVSFADSGRTVEHALWDLGFGLPLTGATITPTFDASTHVHPITVVVWDTTGHAEHLRFTVSMPEPTTGVACVGLLTLLIARRRR